MRKSYLEELTIIAVGIMIITIGYIWYKGNETQNIYSVNGQKITMNGDIRNIGDTPESAFNMDLALTHSADGGWNNCIMEHLFAGQTHDMFSVQGIEWPELFEDGVEYIQKGGQLYRYNPDKQVELMGQHPIGWGEGAFVVVSGNNRTWYYQPV